MEERLESDERGCAGQCEGKPEIAGTVTAGSESDGCVTKDPRYM